MEGDGQGTDAGVLKQQVLKLASMLQPRNLEELASAIAGCKGHAGTRVSAPAKRTGSLPLAKLHNLHSADNTAETASQQSGAYSGTVIPQPFKVACLQVSWEAQVPQGILFLAMVGIEGNPSLMT